MKQGRGFPSGDLCTCERKEKDMLNSFADLWSLMTVFFSTTFLENPLFLGMIVFSTIMATIYIFMQFFQKETWGIK